MPTCKECKYFIQEERHSGRCEKHPYVRTRQGMVEMFRGEPRTLYVSWGQNACKTFEMKDDTEEKNCKHCIHYEACCKWTDFPKQCGIPVCSRFSDVAPKSEVDRLNAVMKEMDEQRAYTINMLGESLEKAKSEVEEWVSKCRDWHEVAELKSQRIVELEAELESKQFRCDSCDRIMLTGAEHRACVKQAKAEVAREIFEEIESKKMFLKDCVGNMGVVVLFKDIAELKKKYIPQNADRCVVCGEIVPEGRQVCLKCQIEKGD